MLTQHSSTQAVTPELTVSRGAVTTFQFSRMITSSGKQNDKEVESSIVHFMQMQMFVIEVLQKSKYHYPALPGTPPGRPWALASFLSSSVQLPCGRARKVFKV